jgi:transposase
MGAWAKGVLAEALDSVCEQRKASHVLVCGAYTSQMDSNTGLLKGKRVGDKFYRENGDVLQADHNAALNVLGRLDDPDISRFTLWGSPSNLACTFSGATERQSA